MARATRTLLLLGGDYAERLDRLYDAIQEAQNDAPDDEGGVPRTMMEQDPVAELSEEYEALKAEAEAEAREGRREVKMLAVGRRQWREFREKYPPRTEGADEDIRADKLYGLNTDAAEDAVTHATLTEPAEVACAGDMRVKSKGCSPTNPCSHLNAFDEWADELSPGEWRYLTGHVWGLAIGARFDPKPPPVSPTLSTS
jgi:hypothetical protein